MIDKDRIPPSHMDYEKFNQAVRDFRREVEKELRLKELLDWLADKLSKKK